MHGLKQHILPVLCCKNASFAAAMASQGAGRSRNTRIYKRSEDEHLIQSYQCRTCIDSIFHSKSILTHVPLSNLYDIVQSMLFKLLSCQGRTLRMVFECVQLSSGCNSSCDRMWEWTTAGTLGRCILAKSFSIKSIPKCPEQYLIQWHVIQVSCPDMC